MIYNLVTSDNWNTSYFENNLFKALIGLEITPETPEVENYTVSVIDQQNITLFQKTFSNVNAACKFLNLRYQNNWEFNNLAAPKSSGGCGSCVAH